MIRVRVFSQPAPAGTMGHGRLDAEVDLELPPDVWGRVITVTATLIPDRPALPGDGASAG